MSGAGQGEPGDVGRKISAVESQAAEHLATIRLLEEQGDEYRRVMRENTAMFEEASVAMGTENYFVQRGLASRKELDSYVRHLADDQEELLAETAREVRSGSEAELERLRQEKAGV